MQRLNERKIPGGIIQNIKSVFENPMAQKSVIRASGLSGVRQFPVDFLNQAQKNNLTPPPKLGEDTDEVLSRLD